MIEELKLFATALKMNSAFTSVDKLAQKWIERDYEGRSWKDLNPRELPEDEKREWYDLHDAWERANKDLKGKIVRFEADPYGREASPILRYERKVESMGVVGKLFLGLNSHQAKGYRIVQLDYPRWFEELLKNDPGVFRSENLSEGEVYALVPSRGIDEEKLSVLRNDFWDDMKEAGVPAFEKIGDVTRLKAEFSSRLEKTIDRRLPFDSNVLRVQNLVEQIKREHALAIPSTRVITVTSPKVILGDKVAPAPKFNVGSKVTYKGATYTILSREFSSREKIWRYELSAPGVILMKPESEITPAAVMETPKPALKSLTEEDILFSMPYRDEEPESLQDIRGRLTKENLDMRNFQSLIDKMLKNKVIFSPKNGFLTWFEKEPTDEEEEAKVEREELKEIIKENEVLIDTFEKELTKPTPVLPVEKPVVPTMPTNPLSSEDMRRLQDFWNTEFFRSLGKVPANISSVFRVEFESVKSLSFEEAKEKILAAADEIIGEFRGREVARRAVPIQPVISREPTRIPVRKEEKEVSEGEEEGGGAAPMGRVPPAQFPSFALDMDLPFPRGPTSGEQVRIYRAFQYQMQQAGYDAGEYQRQFNEYIAGTQFLSWEELRSKFQFFVKTIMAGQELPPLFTWRGVPIPTGLKGIIQEHEPLEKLEDLIVHYSSVVIRNARSRGDIPTLEDLKDELTTHMVIPQETSIVELGQEAKTALTRAIERKDLWVSGISTTEINDFLASG